MKFKDLIEEIKACEYEVKEIGEMSRKIFAGNSGITKNSREKGEYGAIICNDIFKTKTHIDQCNIFVDQEIKSNQNFIERGDIVIARSGYTKNNKHGCRLFLGDSKVLAGNLTYVLKHNENPKYLISVFFSDLFNKQVRCFFKMGLSSMMTLDSSDFKKIKIPIPSLDLQEKIGNFLFKFTEYEKILKREMEKRRKQFHFYKEKIFERLIEKCELRNEEYWRHCIRNIFG